MKDLRTLSVIQDIFKWHTLAAEWHGHEVFVSRECNSMFTMRHS